jgi:hypothetical protein
MNQPNPRRAPLADWVRSLAARFDGDVLGVAPPRAIESGAAPTGAEALAVWARLRAWCDGPARFGVAVLAPGPQAAQAALVEAFSRELDGSQQLAAAGGALAGWLLRLRVKLRDAQWWRVRQPSDPWDAGYLIGALPVLRRFRPRRATLMVADGLDGALLREAVQILAANRAGFHHPVRLLVVGRSKEALAWSSTPSSALAVTEIDWACGDGASASASSLSASR